MSNEYEDMSQKDMTIKGARLMELVRPVEISQEIQDVIRTECDEAFAKDDKCPVGTDIVFMPDVSASMKPDQKTSWAWDTQEKIIEGVVPRAMAHDKEGIDIWPIRRTSLLEKWSNPELECKLNVTDPNEALRYVRSFEDRLGTTPTRSLFAARVEDLVERACNDPVNTKRTLFLISTDGKPDPDTRTMNETTNNAIIAFRRKGLDPCRYLAIKYIIITTDFHIMCGYYKLEDRNSWGPDSFECDVADAMFPFHVKALGGFENPAAVSIALAGAISPTLDKSVESILSGPAKELMDLMHAYIKAGYHEEDY